LQKREGKYFIFRKEIIGKELLRGMLGGFFNF